MTSPMTIEMPGAWRPATAAAVLVLGLLPAGPLLIEGFRGGAWPGVGAGFSAALSNSAWVAAGTGVLSFLVGLPLGVVAGLYTFPGRTPLVALLLLPLVVPSFLWEIGWSSLAARLGGALPGVVSGRPACCLVFLAAGVPLTALAVLAATRGLTASQIGSARLAGGGRAVRRYASRAAALPGLAAASLAAVLTLSDPGPGQILGTKTVASEILTSFSAFYDFRLAARQSIVLALLVTAIALPLAALAAPRLGAQVLARQTARHRGEPVRRGWAVTAGFLTLAALLLFLPLLGLTLPLRGMAGFGDAWRRLADTGPTTVLHAGGAGLLAAAAGWTLALAVGRVRRTASVVLACCIVLFAQPPALIALGLVASASSAPVGADPLLRSDLTVVLALAARLFPVAAVLCLRAWATMPATWAMAASVHGVGLFRYAARVLLPHFGPSLALSALAVALIGAADIGTALLLHRPGSQSFPLAIFTVMANAPESLVAALCVLYVAVAAVLVTGTLYLWGRKA